jgi:hypothetical protein
MNRRSSPTTVRPGGAAIGHREKPWELKVLGVLPALGILIGVAIGTTFMLILSSHRMVRVSERLRKRSEAVRSGSKTKRVKFQTGPPREPHLDYGDDCLQIGFLSSFGKSFPFSPPTSSPKHRLMLRRQVLDQHLILPRRKLCAPPAKSRTFTGKIIGKRVPIPMAELVIRPARR